MDKDMEAGIGNIESRDNPGKMFFNIFLCVLTEKRFSFKIIFN
jgi:hypothetical protein